MTFGDYIIYACLIVFVLYITRVNNMWGVSKGTKKAKADIKLEKNRQKLRKRTLMLLNRAEWVHDNIGASLNTFKRLEYKYRIDRLRVEIKILGRNIKPEELVGIMRSIQILSAFLFAVGYTLTHSVIFFVFILFLFVPLVFNTYASIRIADEDAQLERDFPDFFLILYSRLVQGSKTRLAPTLNDYLSSMGKTTPLGESTRVIKNFVLDLRNNIEIYGDDSIAVMKLRDKYTSAMVVNFCNLAVQALKGVDNSDKLLAFKMELNSKKIEQMRNRADKLVAKGQRAVLVVYAILFQFVLLSWVAKFSLTDGILNIFK